MLSFSPPLATRCKRGASINTGSDHEQPRRPPLTGKASSPTGSVRSAHGTILESRCLNRFRWLRPTDTYAMESWNPYHDTELYFAAPSPLC
ncbi:hypothetical protein FA190_29600, partial [Pseudomonas aeruginosa]|nr:hypothetical protein [Pseudomonas aeruginosa]